MALTVKPIPGAKETAFRGVAYMTWTDDAEVTIAPTIARLDTSKNDEWRKLWSRFDYWVDGNVCDKYFHGWKEPEFRHCFVFKWNNRYGMQRMYGVLFHPKPRKNGRFVLCVLFSHCVKFGKLTDPAQKKKAETLFLDPAVMAAVAKAYPDR